MVCPFCLHEKSDIYNTRSTAKGLSVWRRRRCLNCNKAFTTQENFDPSGIWKVKKAAKAASYSRPKLALSLLRACDHRTNQDNTAWYLFEAVEQQLYPVAAANNQVITNTDISKKTAEILKRFDAAAYVKYISAHSPTMDAQTLRKILRKK
jgi:transcriptional repressor NrdR